MPNNLFATFVVMPTLKDLGLKLLSNALMKEKETLFFISFSRTFTFEKNDLIGSLIMLNERPNKILATDFETQKNGKKDIVNIVNILCYIR